MNKWQQQVYDMLRSASRNNLPCTIPADVTHIPANMMLEADKSKWISVKDRLPENGKLVAFIPTCNQGSVYIGKFYCLGKSGGVMFSHNEGRHRSNYYAKYWMPLPEPPKEDAE